MYVIKMLIPWILKVAALVTDVPDIFISAVDLFCCLCNWNVVLGRIGNHVLS